MMVQFFIVGNSFVLKYLNEFNKKTAEALFVLPSVTTSVYFGSERFYSQKWSRRKEGSLEERKKSKSSHCNGKGPYNSQVDGDNFLSFIQDLSIQATAPNMMVAYVTAINCDQIWLP